MGFVDWFRLRSADRDGGRCRHARPAGEDRLDGASNAWRRAGCGSRLSRRRPQHRYRPETVARITIIDWGNHLTMVSEDLETAFLRHWRRAVIVVAPNGKFREVFRQKQSYEIELGEGAQ
jgi:hypothetical protein